jgi:hypothetical protein
MAIKRRQTLFVFVAAAIFALWWHHGRSSAPPTKLPLPTHSRGGVEDESPFGTGNANGGIDIADPTNVGADSSSLKYKESYPLSSLIPLPSGKPALVPQIQFSFPREDAEASSLRQERLAAVKDAFLHSWTGYKKHAWLKDELAPLTGGQRTTFNGWSATLVDSLDTLWIMGLERDFNEAVVNAASINFNNPAYLPINVFETTIRYLGGFLGAYDISEGRYPILLEKARGVGEVG